MKKFKGNTKYGSNKTTIKGQTFDSKYEAERFLYLLDLQKKGKISQLRTHVGFTIIGKTMKLVEKQLKTKVKFVWKCVEKESSYHNDFCYIENGKYVSEEFKSEYTSKLADYILRRKLMIKKIYEHNEKKHGQWIFREVVYYNKNKIEITDK